MKKVDGKKDMVVYVKLEEYNEIKEIVDLIKEKLKQTRYLLSNITELKNREDAEIEGLSSELSSVEARIAVVNKILKEPEM
jgi:hypothetical protein